ncbi:alpha/beta fold hydrolase [Halobacillus salinus]|uniref:Alpha/beta hydrolase n=1 Tax=Halobacillus salinus TaxID=192814 RepID=A0A4Z0GVS6_9BACI|nr:alpha/beta hydrolase [Halobacillus salinus]TGB01397.1 alpha/beta hydrolase [Halobacillus salinus]
MPYCNVSHAEIYYEDIEEGKPIVMIHGYSPDHRLMKGCMEPVFNNTDGWRRLYIDLPGMGATKNYEAIKDSDEMLKAVIEWIDAVIPGQEYVLVGESYGGYIARGLIKHQPERVRGAAFICPVIIPEAGHRTVPEHRVLRADEAFLASLSSEEAEYFSGSLVTLDKNSWDRFKGEVVSGMSVADEHFLMKVKESYSFSFEVDQTNFDKPALFLLGRQDDIVGYKDALDVMEKYPRGTFAVLDTAGHNLQIEQAEVLNSLIAEWMERVQQEQRNG